MKRKPRKVSRPSAEPKPAPRTVEELLHLIAQAPAQALAPLQAELAEAEALRMQRKRIPRQKGRS